MTRRKASGLLLYNGTSDCWRSAPTSVATLWHFRLMAKYPPGCLNCYSVVVVVLCYCSGCCCRRRRWRKAILSFATGCMIFLLLLYLLLLYVFFFSLKYRQPRFNFPFHPTFIPFLAPFFCCTCCCCCFFCVSFRAQFVHLFYCYFTPEQPF